MPTASAAAPDVANARSGPLDLDLVPGKTLTTHDGVRLAYWVIGEGPKTMMLANGLGGRLYAWEPLIRALYRDYRFITWDYRGLFESSSPERRRHLSISDHAEDARAILDAEGVERAVMCGWSMGVQVMLELSTLYPSRVAGLVLLNGTYGHIFASAFQPLMALPGVARWGHRFIEHLVEHPELTGRVEKYFRAAMSVMMAQFWLLSEIPMGQARKLLDRYRSDIFGGDDFRNYLRLFQELDGHSVYHHLRDIDAPALVISGALDILTPAYQSRAIAARLRNAEALNLRRGSHFVLIERPETVVPAIERFVTRRVHW